MIKLQYLGTGAAEGFPGVFCECEACRKARAWGGKNIKMRSCSLLNDHILIDLSPDVFGQSLRWKVRLSQVDHLVVTHSHEDHLDEFSLCTRTKHGATILPDMPKEKDFVHVYGNETVGEVVAHAIGDRTYTDEGRVRYRKVEIGEKVQVGELTFTALKANHKKDELCHIYAITDGERNLLYANDTGELPDDTFEMIENIGVKFDVVSMDCARGTLPGDGHMGINEDKRLKERLIQIGAVTENTRFYLNHYSHMCGLAPDEFRELAEKENMILADDGLVVMV